MSRLIPFLPQIAGGLGALCLALAGALWMMWGTLDRRTDERDAARRTANNYRIAWEARNKADIKARERADDFEASQDDLRNAADFDDWLERLRRQQAGAATPAR